MTVQSAKTDVCLKVSTTDAFIAGLGDSFRILSHPTVSVDDTCVSCEQFSSSASERALHSEFSCFTFPLLRLCKTSLSRICHHTV